jgi:Zn-finger nucleic acid-binding protein
VELTGSRGAGIAFCPRCSSVPYQLELVGVMLDFCTRCHGVWLDGSDYQEAPFSDKNGPPRPRAPYRAHAAELAATDGRVACVYCNQRFAPPELMFWEHGRICRPCMAARSVRRAARITRESKRTWVDDFFDALMRRS